VEQDFRRSRFAPKRGGGRGGPSQNFIRKN